MLILDHQLNIVAAVVLNLISTDNLKHVPLVDFIYNTFYKAKKEQKWPTFTKLKLASSKFKNIK